MERSIRLNPPSQREIDRASLVEMDRVIKTDKQRREEARANQDRLNREEKFQYRALVKEVMDMWGSSRFRDVTYPLGFVPDGGPQDLDFEGYIIAKKNLKALINSDLTPEDLKERKGLRYELNKYDDSDIFNMTESFRVGDQEPGTVIDTDGLGLSFNVTSGEVVSESVEGSFNGVEIIDPATAPKIGLAMNYDPAGATEVTMMYGDKVYKFNTNGGIPGIQSTGNPKASIAHGKDAEREKMLRLLRYYHLIHTSSEEMLKGFIESEIERGQYTADVDETLNKALEIKKQLDADNGRVTAVFHLSELRTLPGRVSFATPLINMIMDSIEIENNPKYTKRVLRDVAGPFREMLSDEAYEFYVNFLNGGMQIDFTNLDHVKRLVQNLPQLSSFRARQDAIKKLPMFLSSDPLYSGTRPKIYSKFPSLTPRGGEQIWKQMVDPYVWSKMGEELMHSRVKTAGQALGGVIIDLNELFSGENNEPVKFECVWF